MWRPTRRLDARRYAKEPFRPAFFAGHQKFTTSLAVRQAQVLLEAITGKEARERAFYDPSQTRTTIQVKRELDLK